jgi:hypothetical protein
LARNWALEDEIAPKLLPRPPYLGYFEYGELETAIAEIEATIHRRRTAFDRFYMTDVTKKTPLRTLIIGAISSQWRVFRKISEYRLQGFEVF